MFILVCVQKSEGREFKSHSGDHSIKRYLKFTINPLIMSKTTIGTLGKPIGQIEILAYLHGNEEAVIRDLQANIEVSTETIYSALSNLRNLELVNREGRGRSTVYKLNPLLHQ